MTNKEILANKVYSYVKMLKQRAEAVVLYNSLAGRYELKKMELSIDVYILKRQEDIINAYLKKGEDVEYYKMENTISLETKKFYDEYKSMKDLYKMSRDYVKCPDIVDITDEEFDNIFKSVIKDYFPAFLESQTEEAKYKFEELKESYINSDLDRINEILAKEKPITLADIDDEILKNEIATIENDMLKIKQEFPYELLDKDGSLDASSKIKDLKEEIKKLKEIKKSYTNKLLEIEPINGLVS